MPSVISLQNISISRASKPVLKNINIEIEYGDSVAVLGPNGAGKTTFLKVINGLIKYNDCGTVKILGEQLNKHIKKHIGYIPQNNNFDVNMPVSVRDVISIGLTAQYGMLKKFTPFDKKSVEEIAKGLNIYHLIDKPIGQLSGGETQKVSIARVLAQNPKLILMDEPLSNLDNKTQTDILKLIDFIHTELNMTFVIVAHNLNQIPQCCNKVILLNNGEIKIFDKKENAFKNNFFTELYNL